MYEDVDKLEESFGERGTATAYVVETLVACDGLKQAAGETLRASGPPPRP